MSIGAVEPQELSGIERQGIDDTSFRRGQSYVSVFADLDPSERRAVFVAEGRDQQTVEQFAGFLAGHGGDPERIGEVCQDMSGAYLCISVLRVLAAGRQSGPHSAFYTVGLTPKGRPPRLRRFRAP